MTTQAGAPVVVGIDGSTRALDATRLAAAEAARHHRPLRIVHAQHWPRLAGGDRAVAPDSLTSQAHLWLTDAVTQAEKAAAGITVVSELLIGPPVATLIKAARRSFLLVVGDRGLGGFTGLSTGSLAVHAATHCSSPVLVVRGPDKHEGPVVVGLDGSAVSVRALMFAAEEASLRDAELVVVHAWKPLAVAGPSTMTPLAYGPPPTMRQEERVLAESLAGMDERHPGLAVHRELVRGPAAKALVHWSRQARLVVVGSRGRGTFAGLLLGSVSQHLIRHASCPVLVMSDRHPEPTELEPGG